MGKIRRLLSLAGSLVFMLSLVYPSATAWAQGQPITFSAYGDIPYGSSDYPTLQQHIADHNRYSPSAFLIHIGDMLSGSCDESKYADFSNFMKGLAVPAYLVVGDNEYSDCDDPVAALTLWKKYFLTFGESFCGAPYTEHQSVRPENIAFTMSGVLFVGINLVGGSVHDQNEWDLRIQQDADWVSQQFQAKALQATPVGVRAAVVFAQTGNRSAVTPFTTLFRAAAAAFAKPVLYIHGDLHTYKFDQPWPEKNITRLEVPKGNAEPPLEVTINMNTVPAQGMGMYAVKRNPWSGKAPFNMPPCANAGPDQTITSLAASLQGQATDDSDPTGSLTTTWSMVSGPGTVTFGNANALATAASFSTGGTYVLQLTADDGQLQKSDEVTIVAPSGGPTPTLPTVNSFDPANGPVGTQVTITGSRFTNATTVAFNGMNATSFTINSDTQILATVPNGATTGKITVTNPDGAGVSVDNFTVTAPPTQYTLTVNTSGSGSVALNPSGGIYNSGATVTLTATPAAGFQFSGWSGDLAGSTNPATITMDANKIVAAAFTASPLVQYTLTANTVGSGSVALNPSGGIYDSGATVTLTATPAADFQFSGWSGDLIGSTNPGTITMNANKNLTATFTASNTNSNINLAKSKPVTAFSTYSGKPAANAVDGSTSTYWRSGSVSSSNPIAWLRVDLGVAMTVGRAIVRWKDSYYAKNYEIQVSNDGVNWTMAYSTASGKSGVQDFVFPQTAARSVRLYMTKNNKSNCRILEFEVYSGSSTMAKSNGEDLAAAAIPGEFELQQNYPNPFPAKRGIFDNPNTQIQFGLPRTSHVTIKVYTITGAEVETLVDGQYPAGTHAITLHAGNLSSGIYFYVMQAGEVKQVRRLMLVK